MSLKNLQKIKDAASSYFFVIPAIIMFLVFSIYPFYKVFELSVYDWDGISAVKKFVGFGNFWEALTSKTWWQSIRNAGFITFLALTLQNGLALLLALVVDREIKGKNFYRVVFYLPPVLSGIVVGLIWNWIYDGNYGLINHLLNAVGLGGYAKAWLSEPGTALTAVSIIHMWKGFGWGFIILLAGLQSIPRDLYEAAKVDGCGERMIFFKITIPLMVPVFFLVSILTILGTMQIYDIIVSTTGGGPGYHTEVPIKRIIDSMVGSSRFGYACTLGLIFGVVLLSVSMVQIKLSKWLKTE